MNRLKELRESKQINQIELCKQLNMEQPHYSRYEREIVKLNVELVKKLAIFYNISADYILELTDDKKPLY